jgi:putative membrane protein
MKSLALAAATVVLLGGVAMAQAQTPTSRADKAFANTAAAAGLSEVAEAKIALDKSSNTDVKNFAQRMVDDHGKANDQLTQIAQKDGMSVPSSPSSRDEAQANKLSGMSGDAFDKAYIRAQVAAHKKAVALFTKESDKGQNSDLKDFATQTLPTLQEHLQMVTTLAGK